MAGIVPRTKRAGGSQKKPSSQSRPAALRIEEIEPRLMLSGTPTPVHTAPTVAHAITQSVSGSVTGKTDSLSVLGSDASGESKLTYNWAVTSAPAGGSVQFSANGTNAAKNETATFNETGTYTLSVRITDTNGLSATTATTVTVVPTLTSISLTTSSHQAVGAGSTVTVTGTNQAFVVQGLDQFGKALATQPAFKWTTTSLPSGATAPGYSTSGANTTVTVATAGSYGLKVAASINANVSVSFTAKVVQTATSIAVTPGTATLSPSATQQFTAKEYDQFHNVMSTQPSFTWSANGGTVTSGGLFTAPTAAGSDTVTAKSGSLSGTANVTVQGSSNFLGLQNAALASLVQSLDADGSISRNDMMQILNSVAAAGTVTASEFSDLKTILADATKLSMPGYVQNLAGDIINGNAANASFQGKTLGNLGAGGSATQLTELVDKWFLGADEPTLADPSLVYKTVSGSLFSGTPSVANEQQGELGDCYFISSLGTIADSNPTAIQNMFINNGDGTYTVRFYTGSYGRSYNSATGNWSDGFTNGVGTAEYVTVDLKLPTTPSGMLIFSDYGNSYNSSSNVLWIALAEKAYAEWNQTGEEGRDGQNSYASIEGGWMATVDAQVLGYNAVDYSLTNAAKQSAISALAAGDAVTIGTYVGNYGLYADHAYAITGYNASTDTFTLYNPWGFDQPGQLTWSQLEATCDGFVVAVTTGSTPTSGGVLHSAIEHGDVTVPNDTTSTQSQQALAAVVLQDAGADTADAAASVSPTAVDAVFAGGELDVDA